MDPLLVMMLPPVHGFGDYMMDDGACTDTSPCPFSSPILSAQDPATYLDGQEVELAFLVRLLQDVLFDSVLAARRVDAGRRV